MPTTTLAKKEYPNPSESTSTPTKTSKTSAVDSEVSQPTPPKKPKKGQQVVKDTVVFVCDRSKCQPVGLENSLIISSGNRVVEINHGLNYLSQKELDTALKVVPSLKGAITIIDPKTPELLFDNFGNLLSLDSFDTQGVKAILRAISEYRVGWSNTLAKFKSETINRNYLKAITKQEELLSRKAEIAKEETTDLTRQLIDLYAKQDYDVLDDIFEDS